MTEMFKQAPVVTAHSPRKSEYIEDDAATKKKRTAATAVKAPTKPPTGL